MNDPRDRDLAEAETYVLGGLLIDPGAVEAVRSIIEPPMFSHPATRTVYRSILAVVDAGTALDVLTLREALKRTGEYEDAGGALYPSQLLDAVPTAAHIESHARIVFEKSLRRRLVEIASDPSRKFDELSEAVEGWAEESRSQHANGSSGVMSLTQMIEGLPNLDGPEPVVERLAWRGRVSLPWSREKVGKSTFLSAAVASVTNGAGFLGSKARPPQRVLWYVPEEHPEDAVRRFQEFRADPDRLFLLPWSRTPLRDLEAAIQEVEPALVVVDTLAAYVEEAAPDSGDASSWKSLLAPLVRLARNYNVALVILHHATKGASGEYRDSTAIGAEVDMLIEMREGDVPGVRMLKPKGRWKVDPYTVMYEEGRDGRPPFFRLVEGGLSVDQKVLLCLKANAGASKRAVREAVGGRSKDVDGAVLRLLSAGKIEDLGDNQRSEFHIREVQGDKWLSSKADTVGPRSGHTSGDSGAKVCPTAPHTPVGGGARTRPRTPPPDSEPLTTIEGDVEGLLAEATP